MTIKQRAEILAMVRDIFDVDIIWDELVGTEFQSLDDDMKMEHFKKVFDQYTLAEIEERLPER